LPRKPTSILGQTATFSALIITAVLSPIQDIMRGNCDFRLIPFADICGQPNSAAILAHRDVGEGISTPSTAKISQLGRGYYGATKQARR